MMISRGTKLQAHGAPGLWVELACGRAEIARAQELRHRVFLTERGIANAASGLDCDRLDRFCDHLIVRTDRGEVVGTYRMLPPTRATAAGGLYAEGEFEIDSLRPLLADAVEIGRACVDPRFRGGEVLALLWGGLIRYIAAGGYRYVIGCASVDAEDPNQAAQICRRLLSKYPITRKQPVRPRHPFDLGDGVIAGKGTIPGLIKTYIRLGASICGPPAYDAEFRTADLLLLLDMERLDYDHVDRVRRAR